MVIFMVFCFLAGIFGTLAFIHLDGRITKLEADRKPSGK